LSNFPNLSKVKLAISSLRKSGWPDYKNDESVSNYIKQITKILTEHFGIIPDIVKPVMPMDFRFPLFRVRDLANFGDMDLLSWHSYPPVQVSKLNRCNFPGYPVFYCASNPMTAILEVVREGNYSKRKFCLSTWKVRQSKNKFLIQPYLFGDLDKRNPFGVLKDSISDRLGDSFNNTMSADQKEGLRLYLRFMADTFLNDKNFSQSSFFAHRRLYAPHELPTDILIYPSVQTLYKGINMAIHPNFVDTMLLPERFYIIEIDYISENFENMSAKISKYGILQQSQIKWNQVMPNDKLYKKITQEDFGQFGEMNFVKNAT